MKKLILIGVVVLAVAAYASTFVNDSQDLTGTMIDADKDTLSSDVIQMQNPGNPGLTPLYRGFAGYVIVNAADTSTVAPGGYQVYDTAVVTLNGWWDGVKYPVYAFSAKGTLPDTFSIALADTGAMKPLFYYDAVSWDIVVTDTAGTHADDTLLWTATVKTKLIAR